MKLQDLTAKDIMLHDVTTITPEMKVARADLKMVRKGIGGLPVVRNGSRELVGILTQRDIMLSRFSVSVGGMTVQDLMTAPAVSVKRDTCLKEILEKMFENKVERLPVTDENNRLVGLIVHDRILRELYKSLSC
ncbi:MAG: CBS domain-containing protein [Promethearchaeota archaeon]